MTVDDAEWGHADAGLRAALAAADADARHPALRLSSFVAEPVDEAQILDVDGIDDLSDAVPAQVRRAAACRRGAVVEAAMAVIGRCLDDLETVTFDDAGLPDPDGVVGSVVYEAFPPRHRGAYTREFFRDVLVVAVKVGADLADPDGGPAACTAEEILRSHISSRAVELCELAGLGAPWVEPDELLLEDGDFETLWNPALDGIEDDPALQAAVNLDVPAVADWFTPFNRHRVVHPYVRTDPSPNGQLHDLRRRLVSLTHAEREALDWTSMDGPTPVGGLTAISELVAVARAAARGEVGEDVWVPDPERAEESYADLVRVTGLSPRGSGWLAWEPHYGAGAVRSSAVIQAIAHRHFPVGTDEPYLDVSLGSRLLSVPLAAVVSYRPDPEPRRHWDQRYAQLLGPDRPAT